MRMLCVPALFFVATASSIGATRSTLPPYIANAVAD
jgi:hypothetical protein